MAIRIGQNGSDKIVEAWLKFLDGRDAEDLTTYIKRGTINHWGVNADYFSISPVGTKNMGRDISMIYEELKNEYWFCNWGISALCRPGMGRRSEFFRDSFLDWHHFCIFG